MTTATTELIAESCPTCRHARHEGRRCLNMASDSECSCDKRPATAAPSDTDLIGFIDQTLYANRDSSPDVKWRNSEVLRLLGDVRRLAASQPVQVEVTDNTKLIDRAREMRMDAEVGTHVERMRILGELANALQATDAALVAALGGGEPAPTCSEHRPVQHRDAKPPWCQKCGLTAEFTVPTSSLGGGDPVACNCTQSGAHDYGSEGCESGTPQPSTVTEAQVEAAGRVMYAHWDDWAEGDDQGCRSLVRAALDAARLTPAQPSGEGSDNA